MIDNKDKILQNLKDAGCTNEFVEEFFEIRKQTRYAHLYYSRHFQQWDVSLFQYPGILTGIRI